MLSQWLIGRLNKLTVDGNGYALTYPISIPAANGVNNRSVNISSTSVNDIWVVNHMHENGEDVGGVSHRVGVSLFVAKNGVRVKNTTTETVVIDMIYISSMNN